MADGETTAFLAGNIGRAMLTSVMAAPEPNRGYCGNCRGKGFDLMSKSGRRHSRRCQRCRGKGSVEVGSTKR